jgi:hypothetical protein
MKTMMLAAVAALSLASTAAFAGEGQGTVPNTYFTELPGVVAQAPVQAPAATAQSDRLGVYGTRSSQGTWLFPPDATGGGDA